MKRCDIMLSSMLRMCVLTVKSSVDKDKLNRGVISLQVVDGQICAVLDRYLTEYLEDHVSPRPLNMPELAQRNACLNTLSSSTEKEEKAISAIKKDPIPVEQFLQKLRQKKLDKILNFEVRVSNSLLSSSHVKFTQFIF